MLTYTDNTTENHYVPFNPALTGWQFASLAIVPRQANKTVRTIQVVCAYEKNANTAWFDDISLVREAAQTMKYDENGKLVSVKSTDNSEAASEYENGNLIQSVTGGGGTFTYEYDGSHNVTQVTNGLQRRTSHTTRTATPQASPCPKRTARGRKSRPPPVIPTAGT